MSLKWIVLIGTPIWICFLLDFFLRVYPNAKKKIDETDNQIDGERIETGIAMEGTYTPTSNGWEGIKQTGSDAFGYDQYNRKQQRDRIVC